MSFCTIWTPIKKGAVFGGSVIYKKAQTTHYKKREALNRFDRCDTNDTSNIM